MAVFTLFDLVAQHAVARGDHPAVVDGLEAVSYAELVRRAESLAGCLAARGVGRGDRVAVHLPRGIGEIAAMLAALRLGAVYVNIHHRRTVEQLRHALGDCGAKAAFVEPRRAEELLASGRPNAVEHLFVQPPGEDGFADALSGGARLIENVPPPIPAIDVDLACIIYTSGSTGLPKGVMLTHRNWLAAADSFAWCTQNRPQDRLLGLNPLSFVLAQLQLFCIFLVGGTYVIHRVILPDQIVSAMIRQRITAVHTTPVIWTPLLRFLLDCPADFPHLCYVANGGGGLPPPVLDALPRVFPRQRIYLGSGVTEAITTTWLPPYMFAAKPGAMGIARPNVELFVVDPQHGLCGPDQPGELLHRGSMVSPGYWNDPAATAAAFKPNPHLRHLIGDERVLHSGDIVRRDADGFYWFIGRADSMIKSAGVRISPQEIEDVVSRFDAVGEAVAFGVPDEALGQAVHVAVSPRDGRGGPDPQVLLGYCRRSMSGEMIPRRVHTWPGPMPRTPNGKLDRQAVIQACTGPSE